MWIPLTCIQSNIWPRDRQQAELNTNIAIQLQIQIQIHWNIDIQRFDRETGNLLKTDLMGRVLTCTRGFRFLEKQEVYHHCVNHNCHEVIISWILKLWDYLSKVLSIYPGGVQRKDEKRIFVMNTLFNLAETFLIAALIDFFDKQVWICWKMLSVQMMIMVVVLSENDGQTDMRTHIYIWLAFKVTTTFDFWLILSQQPLSFSSS